MLLNLNHYQENIGTIFRCDSISRFGVWESVNESSLSQTMDILLNIECILNIHWTYIECTLNTHWNNAKHGAIHI